MSIGGNTTAELQICTASVNMIGEPVKAWSKLKDLKGWLDLSGGDSRYTTYSSKIQESTHVFIMDYVALNAKPENSRLLIDGNRYDVLLIDDPLGMHVQLEIYLKFTGGQ